MTLALPRPRTLAEWLTVGTGLAVFGYLGWDRALWDPRLQLLLHLIAIAAILGLVAVVLRRGELPRTRIDSPLLGLLAAFALATVSAVNVGMSLRAMAAITAFAAMLPVALLAVRHRPAWVGLVTSVPVLLLSIPTLVTLLSRRLDWVLVGAPGLPPLRMAGEGTPFGSVAVPPFVIIPAWALAGLIEPAWLRRGMRIALVAVGIPMTILSGSRSAWLAIAAAAVIAAAPFAWRHRRRLRPSSRVTWRAVLAGIGALAGVALVVALVVPRIGAITSILYRFALWRDTLAAWQTDPLLGIGPGFMPYARQAAAADFTFPVRQPHSHNLPLGVLGDAGVLGLLAAVVLVATLLIVAGPWRSRTQVGRTAGIVLIGLGIGGLFDDLTFIPGFDLLAISLVAVALLDSGAVEWVRPSVRPSVRWAPLAIAGAGAGAVLLAAMVTADAAGIAYRTGIRSAVDGDWAESMSWLTRAIEIDPWHPAGPAALAVAAEAAGEPDVARRAAEAATALNPGDASAWTNLALLCGGAGDRSCVVHAAERAAATARYGPAELLNAAVILEAEGENEVADRAYRLSLLSQVRTSFVVDWPRTVHIGDGVIPDYGDAGWELQRLVALHAVGEPIEPTEFDDHGVRALAHAMLGEVEAAADHLAAAIESAPDRPATWDIAIVLREAWGEPVGEEMRIAAVVRGGRFPPPDLEAELPTQSFDLSSFRSYPRDGLVTGATRTGTTPPYPWFLAELLP
jgi:O-antigen ligase/tetratricopeptide (TPR) repeat protein